MPLLQGFAQRHQRAGAPHQQVIGGAGHGHQPPRRARRKRGNAGRQPGPFAGAPGLHPGALAPVAGRVVEQSQAQGHSQTVDGPGVAPGGPAPQPLGLGQGIAKPQPRQAIELGQATDHHQVGVRSQQRHQALGLATGHQGQKRLIDDHQPMGRQQGFDRRAAPQLAGGVVGVGDPQRRRRGRR